MVSREYFDSLPPGWSGIETVTALYDIASKLLPESKILELGSFAGRSAVNMSNATSGTCDILCVDKLDPLSVPTLSVPQNLFASEKWDLSLTLAGQFDKHTSGKRITRIPMHYPCGFEYKAQMIYIDAGKSKNEVHQYLTYALEHHLASDGFFCGAHSYHPDIMAGIYEFLTVANFKITLLEGSALWILDRYN